MCIYLISIGWDGLLHAYCDKMDWDGPLYIVELYVDERMLEIVWKAGLTKLHACMYRDLSVDPLYVCPYIPLIIDDLGESFECC